MKKVFFVLWFFGVVSSAFADDNKSVIDINASIDEARNIQIDENECQKKISEFYAVVITNDKQDIKSTKEFADCMAKKAKAREQPSLRAESKQADLQLEANALQSENISQSENALKAEQLQSESAELSTKFDGNESKNL